MESTRRADQDIERLTQCLVGGMLDEAFAENQQGFGNALAQTLRTRVPSSCPAARPRSGG